MIVLPFAVLGNEASLDLHQSIDGESLVLPVVQNNFEWHLLQDFYKGWYVSYSDFHISINSSDQFFGPRRRNR